MSDDDQHSDDDYEDMYFDDEPYAEAVSHLSLLINSFFPI